MSIGDMIFNMMGQADPKKQLAAAIAHAQNPSPLNTPQAAAQAGAPQSADPNFQNPQSSGGPGTTGAANPPPQAPPQPQAYTSPPDLVALYSALADRQQADQGVDRGLGLLLGAFAKPQNRDRMLQAMTGNEPDAASLMQNAVKLGQSQTALENTGTGLRNLPVIAQQLGIPLEQVQSMAANGTLDNLIQQSNVPTPGMKEYADYKKETLASGGTPVDLATFLRTMSSKAMETWGNNGTMLRKKNPDGTTSLGMMQTSNRGGQRVVPIPAGYDIADTLKPIETPTGVIVTTQHGDANSIANAPVIQKDNQLKATQDAAGKAAQQLPMADEAVTQGTKIIDRILTSGDTANNAGFRSLFMPSISSSAGKTANDIDQLKSINFLQAYTQLRGAGNISDAEGIKAQSAFANLQHPERLSDADFRQNLADAKAAMISANQAAHAAAGDKGGGVQTAPDTSKIPMWNPKTRKFE